MLETLRQLMVEHEILLASIGLGSLIAFIASIFFLPWLVTQIPSDYFSHDRREHPRWMQLHPVLRYTILVLKNVSGFVLLLAGIAMLVLPGQGLLSMLMGLILMDYPGKFKLERKIISLPKLLQLINWLRRKEKHPPLVL